MYFTLKVLQDIRELLMTSASNFFGDSHEICDALKMSQERAHEERQTSGEIGSETTTESFTGQGMKCKTAEKINPTEIVELPKCNIPGKEGKHRKQLIHAQETPLESRSETFLENSSANVEEELKKYTKSMLLRERELGVHFSSGQDYLQGKAECRLATGKHKFETNYEKYCRNSNKKYEEDTEAKMTCDEGNLKVSLLDEDCIKSELNNSSRKNINKSDKGVLPDTANLLQAKLSVDEKEDEKAKGYNELIFQNNESHLTKDLVISTEKNLNNNEQDPEIYSQKMANYLDEQFETSLRKGRSYTEEKSTIDSSKNATQSPVEEDDVEEESGSSPDVNSLKNVRQAECMVSLVHPPVESHGKEEEDLNDIIRRMIITELRKHREKESTLKRAYSDTESIIDRKSNKNKNKTALFSFKHHTLIQELRELEESQVKNNEDRSVLELPDSFERKDKIEKSGALFDESTTYANRLESFIKIHATVISKLKDTSNLVNKNSRVNTSLVDSCILLERKHNLLSRVDSEEGVIRIGKKLISNEKEEINKSTQTEHIYVIHAVRSCPLRKKHPTLHLQLHRLMSNREICSRDIYPSNTSTEHIYRKASDNLIYEKAKGSGSPSYIPHPERFRWRYVTPTKVN